MSSPESDHLDCGFVIVFPGRFKQTLGYYLLTYLRSWALLEKLPIVQLLKNFPAFYGTQRFSTVFTRSLHGSLP
jgi:hypothetical protein